MEICHATPFADSPLNKTDIALSRRFHLSERAALYARVEYFNVFNHPKFYFPHRSARPYNGGFGLVTSSLASGLYVGSTTLNPLYQIGGPRSAQFTLKLTM